MKLNPLGDRVVLQYRKEEEKSASGIILPDSAKEKPQEATVVPNAESILTIIVSGIRGRFRDMMNAAM